MTEPGDTFGRLHRATPESSGADRLAIFDALPESEPHAAWKELAARREAERIRDGLIGPDGDR